MPRTSSIKPTLRNEREKKGLAAWCVNVPRALGEDGKRQQLFFSTKAEASAACEKLRARNDNFGVSLTAMTPARIAEAAEAYKLLAGYPMSLIDAVRGFLVTHKARTESISFLSLFDLYLSAKAGRSPDYLRELRITRDRFPVLHDRIVSDITHLELESVLSPLSPGARNPVMRYFRAVFFFGVKRGYLRENPITRLDFAERKRKEIETIPADKVQAMLTQSLENDLALLPYLVFGIFTGSVPTVNFRNSNGTM